MLDAREERGDAIAIDHRDPLIERGRGALWFGVFRASVPDFSCVLAMR